MLYLKHVTIVCFFLACLCECLCVFQLEILRHAGMHMQKVHHPLLKQLILRYSNCAQLNISIQNSEAFVRHSLLNYFRQNPFSILCRSSTILMCTGLSFAAISFTYSRSISFLFFSIFLSLFFMLFHSACNLAKREEALVICLTDYFDNTLARRFKTIPQEQAMIAAAKADTAMPVFKADSTVRNITMPADKSDTTVGNTTMSADKTRENTGEDATSSGNKEEEIIFSVLNDFLV